MYVQFIRHSPAPGKAPALRALLEDWAKTAPARGASHSLSTPMINLTGQIFTNGIRHQDLGAFQEYLETSRSTPEFAAFIAKQQGLLAGSQTTTLHEILVPMQHQDSKFVLTISDTPLVGKGFELQALLEERVRAAQARGAVRGLRCRAFGSDGPEFVQTVGFPDLASLDRWWAQRQSEPGFAEFFAKRQALQARPNSLEVHRILVPFA